MLRNKFRNGFSLHDRQREVIGEKEKYFLVENSHILEKVESELKLEISRSQKRRAHRNCMPKSKVAELVGCNNMQLKYHRSRKSVKHKLPDFVIKRYAQSQDRIFTSKDVTAPLVTEDKSSKIVHFITDQPSFSVHSIKQKLSSKSRKSGMTMSSKIINFKDEASESHMLSIKIKKNDYQEILNHLALCYTFQLIESSSRVPEKNWSGTDFPYTDPIPDFLYVGGFGSIDGVTECNNINLAAKKYQYIDFSNDEAVDALSHMYSMSHLLDGVHEQIRKDSKKMPVRIISNDDESEKSESSSLISE